ncbi:MAG: hypothetical protein ACFFB6_13320, partial [Promethearchaeota archaeon]
MEFTKTSFVKPQFPHFTVANAPFFLISVTFTLFSPHSRKDRNPIYSFWAGENFRYSFNSFRSYLFS